MFTIRHRPSGDTAEAETAEAATLAAKTLIRDNGGGYAEIRLGAVAYDTVGRRGRTWVFTRPGRAA